MRLRESGAGEVRGEGCIKKNLTRERSVRVSLQYSNENVMFNVNTNKTINVGIYQVVFARNEIKDRHLLEAA